jgi:hypothetical protein
LQPLICDRLPDRDQQAFAARVKSEIAPWTPIIQAAGPLN